MNLIILMLIPWVALPGIVEFDYRVFNRIVRQRLTRRDYLLASIVESAMFSAGVLVGWRFGGF